MAKRPRTGWQVGRVALAAAAVVLLAVETPRLDPAAREERAEPPSPEEVRVLDELLEWVNGGPEALSLTAAVSSRPRSFELFRRSTGEAEDRLLLLDEIPYGDVIRGAAERYRLDGLLLAAVIEAESGFDPQAVSPDGALGLMQIMPETGSGFGVTDLRDPEVNVRTGARYLSSLIRSFDGDLTLALAAYNAGPGNVQRYAGMPPFGETRRYVEKVLSRYLDHHLQLWRSRDEGGGWLFETAAG